MWRMQLMAIWRIWQWRARGVCALVSSSSTRFGTVPQTLCLVWTQYKTGYKMYCIAGNFWGRKLSWINGDKKFAEKTFFDCSVAPIMCGCGRCCFFFVDGQKLWKSQRFSPSKDLLYSNYVQMYTHHNLLTKLCLRIDIIKSFMLSQGLTHQNPTSGPYS